MTEERLQKIETVTGTDTIDLINSSDSIGIYAQKLLIAYIDAIDKKRLIANGAKFSDFDTLEDLTGSVVGDITEANGSSLTVLTKNADKAIDKFNRASNDFDIFGLLQYMRDCGLGIPNLDETHTMLTATTDQAVNAISKSLENDFEDNVTVVSIIDEIGVAGLIKHVQDVDAEAAIADFLD